MATSGQLDPRELKVGTTYKSRFVVLAFTALAIVFWSQFGYLNPGFTIFYYSGVLCGLVLGLVVLPASHLMIEREKIAMIVDVSFLSLKIYREKRVVEFGDVDRIEMSKFSSRDITIVSHSEDAKKINTSTFAKKEEVVLSICSKVDSDKLTEDVTHLVDRIKERRANSSS